jgi:calcineurin-like phosphoesterase family protein
MNEEMILRWNDVVKNDSDQVLHLGDVSFGTLEQTKDVLSRLRGRKILVAGNHDRHAKWSRKDKFLMSDHFEQVHDYLRFKWDGKKYVLCHFPFASWERGYVNLHGHTHGQYEDLYSQLDVGADVHNLEPIPLELAYNLSLDNTKQTEYD